MIWSLFWRGLYILFLVAVALMDAVQAAIAFAEDRASFLLWLPLTLMMGWILHRALCWWKKGWDMLWLERLSCQIDEHAIWVNEAKRAYYAGDEEALFNAISKLQEMKKNNP